MKSNRAVVNTIANIVSKVWSMVSIYLFVPIYIKYLGEEAYGLVSFFATMQAALNLLGLGLSSTLRREFALSIEGGYEHSLRKYKLLRSCETIFFVIAVIIFSICMAGSNWIADTWLDSTTLGEDVVAISIGLMGASIALQLVANLYFGAMLGLARQVLANAIHIVYSAVKAIGSVVVIMFVSSDIRYFYVWHVLVDLMYIIIIRVSLVHILSKDGKMHWNVKDFVLLKSIWKYALGLVVISLIAFINKQLDRILISKYVSLTELGAYNSCYSLGQIVTIISSAFATAVFSEFTNLFSDSTDKLQLIKSYKENYRLIVVLAGSIGLFVASYAEDLLYFWTGSGNYVSIMQFSATLIVLGSMILAFQEIPYAFLLAQGNTKINRQMGIISLVPYVLILFILTRKYTVFGAALAYFVVMFVQTVVYVCIVYKKYCGKDMAKWFVNETVVPLTFISLIAFGSKYVSSMIGMNNFATVVFAVLVGGITMVCMLLLFCKSYVLSLVGKKRSDR